MQPAHAACIFCRPGGAEMAYQLIRGTVVENRRKRIHVVRVVGAVLDTWDIDHIAEEVRELLLSRSGEQAADVVVVQGDTRESLRLFGEPWSVSRVRAAMFNAAIRWSPLTLD